MQAGDLAMVLILHTATTVTGCRERACRRPLMDYLAEKMCTLCYQRARYAKLRGCIAIKFPFKRMDLRWVLHRQSGFLKALLFVMMDLTGGVSSGSVEMAKSNLERMRRHCARPLDRQDMEKSTYDKTFQLVQQLTSPNKYVRDQAVASMQVLAELTSQIDQKDPRISLPPTPTILYKSPRS